MTTAELIKELGQYPGDMEVVVKLDSKDGDGYDNCFGTDIRSLDSGKTVVLVW